MGIDKESLKELESMDPDELVDVLGVSSEQIIRAFPGRAYDYIRDSFGYPEDNDGEEAIEMIRRLQDEGFAFPDEGE